MLRVKVEGLSEGDRALRHVCGGRRGLASILARAGRAPGRRSASSLAVTPTIRHARTSLTWARGTLGRGGVFESSPNQLTFGTNVFYSRFSQYGTKRQRQRTLIHVDEADATAS